MDRWSDKIAIVTGAASGIGAAITKSLLNAGVNVIGLDLQIERLEQQATIQNFNLDNNKLYALKCDLSKEEDIKYAFEWVNEKFGGLHILVNNAGVTDYTPIIESDRAALERLLNINVIAMASCITKAVQSMRANNVEGHIFNINSVLGHEIPEGTLSELDGVNGWSLYPASKHACIAMSHTIRREISRAGVPIRITSISPGLVKTEISKHVEALKDLFDKVPALNPTDIADALIYALGTRPAVQITEITVRRTGEL